MSLTKIMASMRAGSEADDHHRLQLCFQGIENKTGIPFSDIRERLKTTIEKVPVPEVEGEGGLFVNGPGGMSLNDDGQQGEGDGKKKGDKDKKKKVETEDRLVKIEKKGNIKLSGTLNLAQLPQMLVHLELAGMTLLGSVNLTALPHTLKYLNISQNGFTGPVRLDRLPAQLSELHLQGNRLTGIVDLSKLPMTMTTLMLQDNLFDWFGIEISDDEDNGGGAGGTEVEAFSAEDVANSPMAGGGSGGVKEASSPKQELSSSQVGGWVGNDNDDQTGPVGQSLRRCPVRPYSFATLPFKMRLLNIGNNRFKNPVDASGVRKTTTVFVQ